MEKQIKKLLVTAALSLISFGAIASDLPSRVPATAPAPVFVAAPSWGGFYVGLQGGYGWSESTHRYGAQLRSHGAGDVDGALLGGTIGRNFTVGSVVLGLEGDFAASWMKGTTVGTAGEPCLRYTVANGFANGGYCGTSLNSFGTARVRLGYAFGNVLVYGTGGFAFGEVEANRPFEGANSWSDFRSGWTVGAGVEYAITQNWSAKVEYLYADLGDELLYPCPTCNDVKNHRVSFETNLVRIGVNYKFGGPSNSVVVARN